MGCDIHCYIEFKGKDSDHWQSFGGEINPGRDYLTFARLAGVRGPEGPLVPRRGRIPLGECGYASGHDSCLYVTEAGDWNNVDRSTAEKWVAAGVSMWLNGDKTRVTNPDWHSHTWLYLREWREATHTVAGPEYRAITAAMESLERDGYETRVVMWFDN